MISRSLIFFFKDSACCRVNGEDGMTLHFSNSSCNIKINQVHNEIIYSSIWIYYLRIYAANAVLVKYVNDVLSALCLLMIRFL